VSERLVLLSAILSVALVLGGCSTSKEESRQDSDAEAILEFAESLEQDSLLDQATTQYAIIAEQYPTAAVYPLAVRRVAFLYAHPDNPARNDTLALRWMRIYEPLAQTREERHEVGVVTSLIQQIITFREEAALLQDRIIRAEAEGDSITTTVRRQGRRIKELETELQQINDELKKLKEVDARTSRPRRR
jgi:hypothetical protein